MTVPDGGPRPVAPGRPAASPSGLPRVVATDLDGTLLRSDGTVSERTRSALRAAEHAGVEVVFVTARPPRWLGALADVVGGHGHVICLGGAAVWDLATASPLDVCGFTDSEASTLVEDLRAAVPGVALAFERVDGPTFDPGFRSTPDDDADVVAVVETTLGHDDAPGDAGRQPVGKILARDPAVPVEDAPATQPVVVADVQTTAQETFFARVRDAVGDRAHLAYSGAAGLAELLAPTVTKDAALARWCARLGVEPRDVWAFGDMPNDLPMLRWAGRSFAVANAHPDVLATATDRTVSNDDDGVARVLLDAVEALLHAPGRTSTAR
ncbi:HAD family hydrolase [Cellulosimicrobium sp. XJ-DQ-B-000]|uniref:HAD family hydrolase n=1 Tax=Cellulosimicrobium sp. XJ-DQ-B-000 TaxID=3072182 RepID=UPI002808987A|nr:HAD family hydrolase [Cellulosimicrobium sp. XJ-DQ-B-000]MDQ8042801.1 HAD family hydrolase [Cellulosimicrobium sp. XJ-DQ-B-000]